MNPQTFVLGLDPGHVQTAAVIWDGSKIHSAQFFPHTEMRAFLRTNEPVIDFVCCEQMSSFGMPVGKEVLETIREIGRYLQVCADNDLPVFTPTRQRIKLHHCRQNGNDAQMRAALIERFGAPGTKKAPGITHGLKSDLWQAFGAAVFAFDMLNAQQPAETLTP